MDFQVQSTASDWDADYSFSKVTMTDLELSQLAFYSKYQDFTHEVIPSAPNDEEYKLKAAHITIRSVDTEDTLKDIKEQLPNNELIFVEKTGKLWIKNNYELINIGSSGGGSSDSGMTETEIIKMLKEMGIVRQDGKNLEISDLSSLTFIHEDTGTKYRFQVDSKGELVGKKVPDDGELLSNRIDASGVSLKSNVRGVIGQLRIAEYNKKNPNNPQAITTDAKLNSDRLKIGAFYAPLDTDIVHGCDRAFVELENTADVDFCLQGCYLHWTGPNKDGKQTVYHLPLTGTIKAGSTYLIVGKRYTEATDANVYVKVDSYDQEWYVDGEIIDFSVVTSNTSVGYGFALTYGTPDLAAQTELWSDSKTNAAGLAAIDSGLSASSSPYILTSDFIDAIYYYKAVVNGSDKGCWAATSVTIKSNTMYKNMFELDPAKQAFQAFTTLDSSRARWAKGTDIWVVDLSLPTIQFPHSDDTYEISMFTPKASYLNKNVSTDKSKLDREKPNMVTCAFGVNIYLDRTFNWISVGYYDEYVWVRKKGTATWSRFGSYKPVASASTQSSTYPCRKEYSVELNNAVYQRITGRFPGDGTFYTSHKCVLRIKDVAVTATEQWEYVVGRSDIDGAPDAKHSSDIHTFTLYPESYTPQVYQITDQQGFHWVEYQVWAAAATKVYEKIKADTAGGNVIPILINTGDMTQNGTRINEWYDYYQAGRMLFKEYEQMNVVGNNDLCGTDVTALGTGDDVGKSNSFYFHVFYCYDIDESVFKPIINGKYVPSLYYFDSKDFRFVMINSEITSVNCQNWYNLKSGNDVVNIYTGYTLGTTHAYAAKTLGFTTIYTMVYKMLTTTKKCIAACHEMPFTVITNASLASNQTSVYRSLSEKGALVGSHCNQISASDEGKGTYWLSRLLEQKGVKLCLGGHKHTYVCTYPLREYFFFGSGKNSKDNFADFSMEETLENDNVTWKDPSGNNTTKRPLTKRAAVANAPSGSFYPCTAVPDLTGGVVYFMCQSTGYKYSSNKELPSANQKFSVLLPQTTVSGGTDKPNVNQEYPMFGIINLGTSQYTIKLARVANIFNSSYKFAQNTYSSEAMKLQYLTASTGDDYGSWKDTETTMLTV